VRRFADEHSKAFGQAQTEALEQRRLSAIATRGWEWPPSVAASSWSMVRGELPKPGAALFHST
jgi:hypothetical protein